MLTAAAVAMRPRMVLIPNCCSGGFAAINECTPKHVIFTTISKLFQKSNCGVDDSHP